MGAPTCLKFPAQWPSKPHISVEAPACLLVKPDQEASQRQALESLTPNTLPGRWPTCAAPTLAWQTPPSATGTPALSCLPIIPIGSMPGGLPGIDRSPGVVLVPGVGASFLGVGVLDLRPGVEDLSF